MKTNSLFNQQELQIHYRYFSEDFKKKRVKELENNLVTISDLCKTYHVSRTSVYRWIYKFSAMSKRQNKQVVEVKSDTRKIQLLKPRITILVISLFQQQYINIKKIII